MGWYCFSLWYKIQKNLVGLTMAERYCFVIECYNHPFYVVTFHVYTLVCVIYTHG
jgi:hypothetical protein